MSRSPRAFAASCAPPPGTRAPREDHSRGRGRVPVVPLGESRCRYIRRPFSFRVDRDPNPHLGFGFGLHDYLGALLAKLELRYFFDELLQRLDWIELAGEPTWMASNLVSGVKRLHVRYRLR